MRTTTTTTSAEQVMYDRMYQVPQKNKKQQNNKSMKRITPTLVSNPNGLRNMLFAEIQPFGKIIK